MFTLRKFAREDVSVAWLRDTAILIQKGETTYAEASQNIHFHSLFGIATQARSVSTLKRMFRENHINVLHTHICSLQ